VVRRYAAEPAVAEEIRATVANVGDMSRSVADQKQNRGGAHSSSLGITGLGRPVDLLIGSFEGPSQQWNNGSGGRSLIQIATKSIDGQLCGHGTAFVPPHAVGYDMNPPQSHPHAAHTVLIFFADGSGFG
jgi:hypothetical protein